jgi:hypothetical protein
MKKPPTIDRDSTVPDEPERFRLWRSIEAHRHALGELIEQGHEDADFYRAVLARLNELGELERPPSDRKLRELDEALAHKIVMLWLDDRSDAATQTLAEEFLSRFRGASVTIADAHARVMAEIRDGIGNTSRRHENIASRIVRKQYRG